MKTTDDKGWGFPIKANRAHYFVNGRALCGRWMYGGHLEDSRHNHPDNCKICMEKRNAQLQA